MSGKKKIALIFIDRSYIEPPYHLLLIEVVILLVSWVFKHKICHKLHDMILFLLSKCL